MPCRFFFFFLDVILTYFQGAFSFQFLREVDAASYEVAIRALDGAHCTLLVAPCTST